MVNAAALVLTAVSLLPAFALGSQATSKQCHCFPNDACWPSPQAWDALNASIDGRLVRTIPLAHICHDPDYDEEACQELRHRWTEPRTQ